MQTEYLVTDLILCSFIYVDNRDLHFSHQYESPQPNFRGPLCTRAPTTRDSLLVCGGRPNVVQCGVHVMRFEKTGGHKEDTHIYNYYLSTYALIYCIY